MPKGGPGSSVGIGTGYGLEGPRIESRWRRDFSHTSRPVLGPISRYRDWLRAGGSGDRILVEARFFAQVQTGPGAHPTSSTTGNGFFPGIKHPGRGADTHPFKGRGHK
jgi:hypothetical protein